MTPVTFVTNIAIAALSALSVWIGCENGRPLWGFCLALLSAVVIGGLNAAGHVIYYRLHERKKGSERA